MASYHLLKHENCMLHWYTLYKTNWLWRQGLVGRVWERSDNHRRGRGRAEGRRGLESVKTGGDVRDERLKDGGEEKEWWREEGGLSYSLVLRHSCISLTGAKTQNAPLYFPSYCPLQKLSFLPPPPPPPRLLHLFLFHLLFFFHLHLCLLFQFSASSTVNVTYGVQRHQEQPFKNTYGRDGGGGETTEAGERQQLRWVYFC